MSQQWSEPLDDFTQDFHVLDVPPEFLLELSDDVIATLRKIQSGKTEQRLVAAKFVNNIDRVMALLDDSYVTVCVHQMEDGTPEKCCTALDVCTLIQKERRERQLTAQHGISLVMKPWLDISGGSEFQVFVADSSIKGLPRYSHLPSSMSQRSCSPILIFRIYSHLSAQD